MKSLNNFLNEALIKKDTKIVKYDSNGLPFITDTDYKKAAEALLTLDGNNIDIDKIIKKLEKGKLDVYRKRNGGPQLKSGRLAIADLDSDYRLKFPKGFPPNVAVQLRKRFENENVRYKDKNINVLIGSIDNPEFDEKQWLEDLEKNKK
jgi:hypothetical protein